MNRLWLGLLLLLCSFFGGWAALAANADSAPMGMVTGNKTGTQIEFGNDIAKVAKTVGLDILVKESQGSIDNVRRMESQENAALGIVNSDVLGFLSRSENPQMRQIASRLRLIFPFYNAEVHLFANKSIKVFGDLQDKRIVAGESGSGSWLTTMNLLQLTGVKPAALVNLSQLEAVSAVLKGEADAMFYVSGKPISLFTKVGNLINQPEFAAMLANAHFVPLDDSRMLQEYQPAQISQADYDWMNGSVPTIAVKTVLMSFDFSSKQNPYFTMRCQQLAKLGQVIRAHMGQLRQTGHPKWKEVNLDEAIGDWKPDTCSRSANIGGGDSKLNVNRELEKLFLKP